MLIESQIVHGEVEQRVREYHKQAQIWLNQGRTGAARLAVEKILLLSPEDKDALELYEKIRASKSGAEKS